MDSTNTASLILTAVGAVMILLILVMKVRLHAFIALMLVSVGTGIVAGMPLEKITESMQKGMAGTLGFLAVVVTLGAMFGRILHETGALEQIANKLINLFGEKRSAIAIGFIGLICALPLFFDVAIVLMIGMVFALAKKTDGNITRLAVALFAGVAAAAAFLLPGPTPSLVASQMHADYGSMIGIGLVAALIGMLLAGPLWGSFISKKITIKLPELEADVKIETRKLPSFAFSISLMLFPLILVGLNTVGSKFIAPDAGFHLGAHFYPWQSVLQFIGHPFIAILLACLIAIYGLATRYGLSRPKIMEICTKAIEPAGIILVVTGAGGVFKQVLIDSNVGPVLGEKITHAGLSIALACFILSAAVRVIQGSATVACLTAVGLALPVVQTMGLSGAQLAALAVCISGGSIVLSHVNDSGFWLFSRFTGASEAQTLATWSMMETILGTTGGIVDIIAFQLLS